MPSCGSGIGSKLAPKLCQDKVGSGQWHFIQMVKWSSGSSDQTVRLWDVSAQTLQGHEFGLLPSFSPMECCSGSMIKPRSGICKMAPASEPTRTYGWGWAVAFSPDGHTPLSGSSDQTVRLWDVQDGSASEPTRTYELVWAVAFSPDGQLAEWQQ